MNLVKWLEARDCDPSHGLDMDSEHDRAKVEMLAEAFTHEGFDRRYPALVGYVKDGRVQLLSGTHRHRAALLVNAKIPVVLWLGSDIDQAWGTLEDWQRVMQDIPVRELQQWTRDDLMRGSRQ